MRKRLAAIVLGSLAIAVPAQSIERMQGALSFTEWAESPVVGRAVYLSGVLETLFVYSQVLGYSEELNACLAEKLMPYGEMAENVIAYIDDSDKDHLRLAPAPAAIVIYLGELCPEARAKGL